MKKRRIKIFLEAFALVTLISFVSTLNIKQIQKNTKLKKKLAQPFQPSQKPFQKLNLNTLKKKYTNTNKNINFIFNNEIPSSSLKNSKFFTTSKSPLQKKKNKNNKNNNHNKEDKHVQKNTTKTPPKQTTEPLTVMPFSIKYFETYITLFKDCVNYRFPGLFQCDVHVDEHFVVNFYHPSFKFVRFIPGVNVNSGIKNFKIHSSPMLTKMKYSHYKQQKILKNKKKMKKNKKNKNNIQNKINEEEEKLPEFGDKIFNVTINNGKFGGKYMKQIMWTSLEPLLGLQFFHVSYSVLGGLNSVRKIIVQKKNKQTENFKKTKGKDETIIIVPSGPNHNIISWEAVSTNSWMQSIALEAVSISVDIPFLFNSNEEINTNPTPYSVVSNDTKENTIVSFQKNDFGSDQPFKVELIFPEKFFGCNSLPFYTFIAWILVSIPFCIILFGMCILCLFTFGIIFGGKRRVWRFFNTLRKKKSIEIQNSNEVKFNYGFSNNDENFLYENDEDQHFTFHGYYT